jgi:hypothetical protein
MVAKSASLPGYLKQLQKWKVIRGRQVWTNCDRSRFYTWDALHGEIEVFDRHGHHLGALDSVSGQFIKHAVRGRTLGG